MNKSLPTVLIVFFLVISLISTDSLAHTRSQSFSQWHFLTNDQKDLPDTVQVSFNILTREITRLAADASVDVSKDLPQILIEHLQGKIQANIGHVNCTMTKPLFNLPASKGYTRLEAEFSCPKGDDFQLTIDGFFDVVPSHLHYARVISGEGVASEMVLSDAVRSQVINLSDTEKDYWQIGKTYLDLGFEHILIGNDHLVFLLALLLLFRRVSHALVLVTGFTLGHSITLSLSVFGWLQPNMATIEALIGFSIALVALEKIQQQLKQSVIKALVAVLSLLLIIKLAFGLGLPPWSLVGITLFSISYLSLAQNYFEQPDRNVTGKIYQTRAIQFLLTTAFGFIHGFGFADVLREIGLPPTQLGWALFSFNIGVELGQLFALTLMALVMMLANKIFSKKQQQFAMSAMVSTVLGLGCYWFVLRSF